eukprot:scaffold150028_cov21-Tisochrysis_lutea.AAC.1
MLTARVHPGESNSSWMVRGLIEYLTGSSAEACMLRKHFVFKIVPMLNPDGASGGYGILSARERHHARTHHARTAASEVTKSQ